MTFNNIILWSGSKQKVCCAILCNLALTPKQILQQWQTINILICAYYGRMYTILYISNNTKSILFSAVFIIFLFSVSFYFVFLFVSLSFPFISMVLCAPRSGRFFLLYSSSFIEKADTGKIAGALRSDCILLSSPPPKQR